MTRPVGRGSNRPGCRKCRFEANVTRGRGIVEMTSCGAPTRDGFLHSYTR